MHHIHTTGSNRKWHIKHATRERIEEIPLSRIKIFVCWLFRIEYVRRYNCIIAIHSDSDIDFRPGTIMCDENANKWRVNSCYSARKFIVQNISPIQKHQMYPSGMICVIGSAYSEK